MALFTAAKDSENYRTYHLRVPVRSYFWEAVRGEQTYGRTPPPAPTVALEVGAIKGIQSFYIHEGYELVVHKAASYSWAEIETELGVAVDKHDQTATWLTLEDLIEIESILVTTENDEGLDVEEGFDD